MVLPNLEGQGELNEQQIRKWDGEEHGSNGGIGNRKRRKTNLKQDHFVPPFTSSYSSAMSSMYSPLAAASRSEEQTTTLLEKSYIPGGVHYTVPGDVHYTVPGGVHFKDPVIGKVCETMYLKDHEHG